MNQIVSVGTSHHVAPIEFREKLAFSEEQLIEFLQRLRESDRVQEAVILSTCNRVEVYALAHSVRNADAAAKMLVESLARYHRIGVESLKKWCYLHHNLETIQHLFRVTSSLDSMVVGESQILGQVKTAYDLSRSAGGVGTILNRLFTKAFSVGKRIRSETTITAGAVSISYAAVELAKKIFNTLEGKTVAIIGAGEMSELTANISSRMVLPTSSSQIALTNVLSKSLRNSTGHPSLMIATSIFSSMPTLSSVPPMPPVTSSRDNLSLPSCGNVDTDICSSLTSQYHVILILT